MDYINFTMSFARKQRGATQNIFLIETIIDDSNDNTERKYVVMGSTGNVYNVIIKDVPECTCPDYMTRGKRCKHIYFILIRVMKSTNEDQEEYSKDELHEMFNNIPQVMNNLIVDNKTKTTYEKLKQSNKLSKSKPETTTIDQKNTDDLCPVCLDDLDNGDDLDYCKFSCGKPIHIVCYGMWTKKHPMNCIFCKKSWIQKETASQYVNLTTIK
jgi:hypothetical protein